MTNRSRSVYYVGFPLVTFGLCMGSYLLGYRRGQQMPVQVPAATTESEAVAHTEEPELAFFSTLKEKNLPPESSGPVERKVSEKAAEKKPRQVPSGRLALQISAFRDLGRAHEMVDALKSKGFLAFTTSRKKGDEEWYRVLVGPLLSENEATDTNEKLSSNGFQKGFMTRLDSEDRSR